MIQTACHRSYFNMTWLWSHGHVPAISLVSKHTLLLLPHSLKDLKTTESSVPDIQICLLTRGNFEISCFGFMACQSLRDLGKKLTFSVNFDNSSGQIFDSPPRSAVARGFNPQGQHLFSAAWVCWLGAAGSVGTKPWQRALPLTMIRSLSVNMIPARNCKNWSRCLWMSNVPMHITPAWS